MRIVIIIISAFILAWIIADKIKWWLKRDK